MARTTADAEVGEADSPLHCLPPEILSLCLTKAGVVPLLKCRRVNRALRSSADEALSMLVELDTTLVAPGLVQPNGRIVSTITLLRELCGLYARCPSVRTLVVKAPAEGRVCGACACNSNARCGCLCYGAMVARDIVFSYRGKGLKDLTIIGVPATAPASSPRVLFLGSVRGTSRRPSLTLP